MWKITINTAHKKGDIRGCESWNRLPYNKSSWWGTNESDGQLTYAHVMSKQDSGRTKPLQLIYAHVMSKQDSGRTKALQLIYAHVMSKQDSGRTKALQLTYAHVMSKQDSGRTKALQLTYVHVMSKQDSYHYDCRWRKPEGKQNYLQLFCQFSVSFW